MKGNKRAQSVNMAITVGLGLVILGLILTVGQDIISTLKDDYTSASYQYNASDDANQGLDKISNWQKTMGLVAGAAVVITFVVAGFARLRT